MSKQQHLKSPKKFSRLSSSEFTTEPTSLFPFSPSIFQRSTTGIALAGLYAVLMLTIALQYHTVGDYNVETDFFWSYVPLAKQVLHGKFIIEDFHGPAYPVFLALAGTILGDLFRAGIILSVLTAAGTLWFTYEILRKLFRADVAFVATLFIAVNNTFVQYSYTAGTDMVFNFFVTGSVFFLLRNEQRHWFDIFLSCTLAALAYLTRYNGLFILVAAPVLFLFVNSYEISWKKRIETTAIYLGMFIAMVTPWGMYCAIEKGSFFYNRNYLNIAYEMFAKGKVGWDQYWFVEAPKFHSLAQVIFVDPALFVKTIASNIYTHLYSDMELLVQVPLSIATVAGILVFWKEKPTKRQIALLVIGACFFTVLLLVFYGERFSMFLLLVYVALAARAFTWHRLASIRFWNRIQIGALVSWVLLIWAFVGSFEFNRVNINSGPQEIPIIADWYHKNIGVGNEQQIIIARKPHIAYYLGMTMSSFPYVQSEDELHQQVQTSKASYLFFSTMEAGMRPQFQYLLDPLKAPQWLSPIIYTISPPAVLYRVTRDSTIMNSSNMKPPQQ